MPFTQRSSIFPATEADIARIKRIIHPPRVTMRSCETCKHEDLPSSRDPCRFCAHLFLVDKWEPKESEPVSSNRTDGGDDA